MRPFSLGLDQRHTRCLFCLRRSCLRQYFRFRDGFRGGSLWCCVSHMRGTVASAIAVALALTLVKRSVPLVPRPWEAMQLGHISWCSRADTTLFFEHHWLCFSSIMFHERKQWRPRSRPGTPSILMTVAMCALRTSRHGNSDDVMWFACGSEYVFFVNSCNAACSGNLSRDWKSKVNRNKNKSKETETQNINTCMWDKILAYLMEVSFVPTPAPPRTCSTHTRPPPPLHTARYGTTKHFLKCYTTYTTKVQFYL